MDNHYFTSVNEINDDQLQQFLQSGLCFIALPPSVQELLGAIRAAGLDFFHLPEAEKTPFRYDKKNGYLNQAIKTNADIQRYIYRDTLLAPPFIAMQTEFQTLKRYFAHEIFQPLAQKIFRLFNLEQHVAEFFDTPDQTLSLIYYPPTPETKERLRPHKDAVTFTALWAPEAVLEANFAEGWQPVGAHPHHVAINLGEALELATGNQLNAIEHRVALDSERERFSLASFYGPNNNLVFTDYTNGKIINPRYGEYVAEHIAKVYEKKVKLSL